MPEMMEIYKKYAVNYDELVSAEDYKGNLKRAVLMSADWEDAITYEAGIGTGRVTGMYIDKVRTCYGFDREGHMLNRCRENLESYADKLVLNFGDNLNLPKIDTAPDIFIEGWSMAHTVIENSNFAESVVHKIIKRILSFIKKNGTIIFIESMGTNVSDPVVHREATGIFYDILEHEYSFEKQVIQTDYKFSDPATASRVMGFFFGPEMAEQIRSSNIVIIPEYTGIWVKKL